MEPTRETVLITGASAGIGRELARLFAADRSNLVLVARRKEKLQELTAELRRNFGIETLILVKDLADPKAPQEIFDELSASGTAVDVLVNNAGLGAVGLVVELDLQRQIDIVQVNVTALTALARWFLPGMIERRRGGVLNVGSTAGFQPGPRMAVYYAAKAYVLSFTDALAEELAGTGVTATCLAPGPTRTEFSEVAGMDDTLLFALGPMSAVSVARAGYRGFRRGRSIVVPGLANKLGVFSVRLSPRILVRKVVERLNYKRGLPAR